MSARRPSCYNAHGDNQPARRAVRTGKPMLNESLWADEGAVPRQLDAQRHDFDFAGAIDLEKIDALLAWNQRD